MECSPHRKHNVSCFLDSELKIIAHCYNQLYSNVIDLRQPIYPQLQKLLFHECGNNTQCWIEHKDIETLLTQHLNYTLKNAAFKPHFHHSRYQWLSTTDINILMEQYTNFDPSFIYLGTYPSNIYQLMPFTKLLNTTKHYKKIGLILNLDTHKQQGSHWVAIYVDNIQKTIEFFDSIGNPPKKHIIRILKIIQQHPFFTSHKYKNISLPFQTQDGECGIYAVYYILQRILNTSSQQIQTLWIRDHEMNQYRNLLYQKRA